MATESHPMYLMSANGMNGVLSCSNSFLTSSNFVMSIDLVRIPCAMMPYVGTRTEAPLPILPDQSSANCLSASASSILVVLMLRSPLFSWFADTTRMFSMCLCLLCSIARSTWLCRVRGVLCSEVLDGARACDFHDDLTLCLNERWGLCGYYNWSANRC
jgi:hypothetical protein